MNTFLFKLLIIFIVLILPTYESKAQTQNQNDLKYWKYRERLLNDFMICVCPNDGGSIPASFSEPSAYTLNWGDATIDLGFYIGTLALEHALLSNSGSLSNYPSSKTGRVNTIHIAIKE